MPRLKKIEPSEATGRAKEIFQGPLKGKSINIFKGMANSGAGLDAYLGLAGALKNASLSAKEQEVLQLVSAQASACEYCQAAHTAIGKGAGLTEAQTVGARKGRIEDDSKLNALARFGTALVEKRGFVSDEDIKAFRSAGYDDGAVVEVLATLALAQYTNWFNHVNQTEVDFPTPPKV